MIWMLALLFTLVSAFHSYADCTIVLKGNVTCEGGTIIQPPVPPVVVPPVVPPPLEDTSPFQFPPQPTIPEKADQRYTYIQGTGAPMTLEGGFYTGLNEYPAPLASYLYAGNVPNGQRLWVPRSANPAWIRRVLQKGSM